MTLRESLFVLVSSVLIFSQSTSAQDTTPNLSGRDPFEILGVEKNATFAEIKRAYLTAAKIYHPDVSPLPFEQANANMQVITNAFSELEEHLSGNKKFTDTSSKVNQRFVQVQDLLKKAKNFNERLRVIIDETKRTKEKFSEFDQEKLFFMVLGEAYSGEEIIRTLFYLSPGNSEHYAQFLLKSENSDQFLDIIRRYSVDDNSSIALRRDIIGSDTTVANVISHLDKINPTFEQILDLGIYLPKISRDILNELMIVAINRSENLDQLRAIQLPLTASFRHIYVKKSKALSAYGAALKRHKASFGDMCAFRLGIFLKPNN